MMPITWKLEPAHILELLLESAPVGITVLTTDLKYVVVSRTVAEEFVQLPEKEILGRYCYDVIGTYRDDPDKEGPDRICDGCPALRCLSTGEKTTGMRQIRPDLIIRDIAVPVREEGGEVVGVMECLENVADKVTDPLTKIRNYRYYPEVLHSRRAGRVRLNAAVSKTVVPRKRYRGFEAPPLRLLQVFRGIKSAYRCSRIGP